MHEAQQHKYNSFITLTLSDETLASREGWEPTVPSPLPQNSARRQNYASGSHARDAHDQPHSLYKSDVQLFLKRLRYDQSQRGLAKIKFYAVGEYGDKNGRPHYHLALFGEEFSDDRYAWRKAPSGNQLYRSPRLEKLWTLGTAEIGDLTFESAAYIARYIMKKINGDMAAEHYKRTNKDTGEIYWILPEFNLMSRGGKTGKGIGNAWLEKYVDDVYPHDYVVMNGQKLKPPRYYDKHLAETDPIGSILMKLEREFSAHSQEADNTPQRLATKEKVAQAKLNLGKRSL